MLFSPRGDYKNFRYRAELKINDGGNSGMYCHGMTTLVLSQLWGMTGDEEVKKCLEKAVKLIVKCQSADGGWREGVGCHGGCVQQDGERLNSAVTSGLDGRRSGPVQGPGGHRG